MKKLLILSLGLVMIISCGQPGTSTDNDLTYNLVGVEFYNEFVPCVGGSDFNQENVERHQSYLSS